MVSARATSTVAIPCCTVHDPACDTSSMESDTRLGPWDRVLLIVVVGVAVYALGLVVFGLALGDEVFARLGFGPGDGEIIGEAPREYVQLIYGVLGAVIVGWMVTLGAIVVGPLRRREEWAWWAVVSASVIWFALDTGLSLALGFVGHALFNVGFAVALAVPLAAIRMETD